MKALLLSIQPKHLCNILNGYKRLEIRKSVPKGFKGWVYLYETKSSYKKTVAFATGQGTNIKQSIFEFPNGCKKYFKDGVWYYDTVIKGSGRVVARFWLDKVDDFQVCEEGILTDGINDLHFLNLEKETQLTFEELKRYIKDGQIGYAWHIKSLEIFEKPKDLGEFYKYNIPYVDEDMIIHAIENNDVEALNSYMVSKAPQSYMFIEVIE